MKFYCFLFLLLSCSPTPEYPFKTELDRFLEHELNYKIGLKDVVLIMLPLDTCIPCLTGTIDLLSKHTQESFIYIISTSTKNDLLTFGISKLKIPESHLLMDSKNMYKKYEIGVQAPVIFHFKNGSCVFYAETVSSNHARIKKYFSWSS